MKVYLIMLKRRGLIINPGTLRRYLGSFNYFLDFVKWTGSEGLSGDKIRDLKRRGEEL